MTQQLRSGSGWRLGWNPAAEPFCGLVGADDWAIELTQAELDDFCRLLMQLAETIESMRAELMPEENLSCEVESDLLWLQAEGFPHAYALHLMLRSGRRAEGSWKATAVPEFVQAVQNIMRK